MELRAEDLGELYRAARQRYATGPDFRRRSADAEAKLRAGDPWKMAQWCMLTVTGLQHLQDIYDRLNVTLDCRPEIARRLALWRAAIDEHKRRGMNTE